MKKYLKILLGFPMGIAMLVVTYILIGAIDGGNTFTEEISKLSEYKYLLAQTFLAGTSYIVVAATGSYIMNYYKNSVNKEHSFWKDLAVLVFGIAMIPISALGTSVIGKKGTFKGYVGDVFMQITAIGLIILFICALIYYAVESKKINEALKARNNATK